MEIHHDGRYWAIYDEAGTLVCLTVYKKGATEVVRRLTVVQIPVPSSQDVCTNGVAETQAPAEAPPPSTRRARRSAQRSKTTRSTPEVAAVTAGDGAGQARRLGTVLIRVDVVFEGEAHGP